MTEEKIKEHFHCKKCGRLMKFIGTLDSGYKDNYLYQCPQCSLLLETLENEQGKITFLNWFEKKSFDNN